MKIRAFQVTPGMHVLYDADDTIRRVERVTSDVNGRVSLWLERHPEDEEWELCAADMVVEIDPDRDPAMNPGHESERVESIRYTDCPGCGGENEATEAFCTFCEHTLGDDQGPEPRWGGANDVMERNR